MKTNLQALGQKDDEKNSCFKEKRLLRPKRAYTDHCEKYLTKESVTQIISSRQLHREYQIHLYPYI